MGSRIQLAGTVSIEHEGATVGERSLPGRQARLAFTYLVLERDGPVTHRALADALWPDGPPSSWQPALRTIASKVRAFLDLAGIDGSVALSGEPGRYLVSLPAATIVDVEAALDDVRRAEDAAASGRYEEARTYSSSARAVLVQPFLPGVDSPWVERWRDRLRSARSRCLEVLGDCRLQAGETGAAVAVLEEAVRLDPLRESAWRGVMRAHAADGNRAKALETYEQLRQVLANELGTDPSPATSDLHLELLQGAADTQGPPRTPGAPDPRARPNVTPYLGLATFTEAHAPLFFGRESDIRALVDLLDRHRFVAVVGPSGSGKSSLVRAGLIPALAHGALPDSDTWLRRTLLPGEHPLAALAMALSDPDVAPEPRLTPAALRTDPAALHAAAEDLLAGGPASADLLLVVDQLEELFTQTSDGNDAEAFIAALLEATGRPDARTVVVATLRADFYAAAARRSGLADVLNRSQYVVGPLDADGLERAIVGPAQQVGARLETGLVARILTDVAGQPGALPLLQHALLELWLRADHDTLTVAAYDAVGGIAGALVHRAEGVFAALGPERQAVARHVLLRLITLGDAGTHTRRRVPLTEFTDTGTSSAVDAVVAAFVQARLLTTSSGADGSRYLEVAHEALIDGWPRLAGWIDESRDDLRLHRRVTDAARDWEAADRGEDRLWRGGQLASARAWADRDPERLNDSEAAFLDAAISAQDRSDRRRRQLLHGLVAASLVVAAVFAALTFQAQRQGDLARSRQLAAQSAHAFASDAEAALLLALEGYEIAPTAEAEAAVRAAHAANALDWRSTNVGNEVVKAAPDGAWVASYGEGPVAILDSATGEVVGRYEVPDARYVNWVDVADDGRVLVSLQGEETVVLGPDLEEVARLPNSLAAVWTPNGSHIVGGGFFEPMYLADAQSYAIQHRRSDFEFLTHVGDPYSGGPRPGTFSPAGQMITLLSGDDNRVAVVDLDTGEDVHSFQVAAQEGAAAFSPSGRQLALEQEGTLVVYDAAEWDVIDRWPLEDDLVDLVWIDERRLATLTASGTGTVRDLDGDVVFLTGLERAWSLRRVGAGVLGVGPGSAVLWDPATGARLQRFAVGALTGVDAWQIDATADHLLVPEGGAVTAFSLDPGGQLARPLAADVPGRGPFYGLLGDGRIVSLTADFPGKLQLLDPDRMQVTHEVPVAFVEGVAVDDGGTRIAAAAPDTPYDVVVYDADLRERSRWTVLDPGRDCPPDDCHISWVAFSPGGLLGVGTRGGHVRVYEPGGGLVADIEPGPAHVGARMRLVFESDDHLLRLALDSEESLARVAISDGTVQPLPGHDGRPVTVATRDRGGRRVALADTTGRVTVWPSAAPAPTAVLEVGTGVRMLQFTDRDHLLVTDAERAVLWDLRSSRPVASFGGNPSELRGGVWLGDHRFATFGRGGDVRLHLCRVCGPIDQVVEAARSSLTREITEMDRVRYSGG